MSRPGRTLLYVVTLWIMRQRLATVVAIVMLVLSGSVSGLLQVEAEINLRDAQRAGRYYVAEPNAIAETALHQAAPPVGTSGAYPSYPLNHTLDAMP
ncbi:MAG TPA: hypothetical protein PK691_05135 [Thermomicrobiales bacterium]|nr:hypothetical protein [Thermomicrobiales bacterium]HRA48511.1 hypothetical protein [Thermomicrobiales bacterium]